MNNYPNYSQGNYMPSNNYNFNKCNYSQAKIANLYDSYAGFIRGNMFPDLYNTYKISKPFDIEPLNEQAEKLTYIDALCFACIDLNLYLDNFPNNKELSNLFKQYVEEKERAIKEYEQKYGPLTVDNSVDSYNNWRWNSIPWPWENK